MTGPAVPLAKPIWTDDDFAIMGWHDNAVHALAFQPAPPYPGRLLIDLDYIIEWVQPAPPAKAFTFWICPATLVFDHAWDLSGEIELERRSFDMSLASIDRSEPDERGNRSWTLLGHEFQLRLHSTGYTQYLRRPPLHNAGQRLSPDQRGGLSFDESSYTP